MRIYLAGPPGPDQVATRWLMEQRGYDNVVCDSDLLRKSYPYNQGMAPSKRDFARYRSIELAQAALCVLPENAPPGFRAMVAAAARFAGIPVVDYAKLPAQAPSIMREDQLFAELEEEHAPAMASTPWTRAKAWASRMASAFDERWGWFFTNGNKAGHRPKPKPYTVPKAAHNITG